MLDAETALVPAAGSTSIRLQEALQQTYADIRETMTFSKEAGARRLFSPDLELGTCQDAQLQQCRYRLGILVVSHAREM